MCDHYKEGRCLDMALCMTNIVLHLTISPDGWQLCNVNGLNVMHELLDSCLFALFGENAEEMMIITITIHAILHGNGIPESK